MFLFIKKWSSANLSLNKVSLNQDCTVDCISKKIPTGKLCTVRYVYFCHQIEKQKQNGTEIFEDVMAFTNYDEKLFWRQKKLHEKNSGHKSIKSGQYWGYIAK